MLDRLRKLDEQERAATFGLRADRADTILPAAVILTRVAEAAGAKTIDAPGVGIRDGILAELAAECAASRIDRLTASPEHVVTVALLALDVRDAANQLRRAHRVVTEALLEAMD